MEGWLVSFMVLSSFRFCLPSPSYEMIMPILKVDSHGLSGNLSLFSFSGLRVRMVPRICNSLGEFSS